MEGWDLYPFSLCDCDFTIGSFLCITPAVLHCEGLPIHFSEINIQNIRVAYSKVLILYGGLALKKVVTRLRTVKVMLYAHEKLTFPLKKIDA